MTGNCRALDYLYRIQPIAPQIVAQHMGNRRHGFHHRIRTTCGARTDDRKYPDIATDLKD